MTIPPPNPLSPTVTLNFEPSLQTAVTDFLLALRPECLIASRVMAKLLECSRLIDAHSCADDRQMLDSLASGQLRGVIAYRVFDAERLARASPERSESAQDFCLAAFSLRCGFLPAARLESSDSGVGFPKPGYARLPASMVPEPIVRRQDVIEVPREMDSPRTASRLGATIRVIGCVTTIAPGAIWASRTAPAPRRRGQEACPLHA